VIALDTNILVYAHRADLPWHEQAAEVVDTALSGPEAVALCWPVVHEFLAVVTNSRIFVDATPPQPAFDQAEHWMSSPRTIMLTETRQHLATLRRLVVRGRASGGALHDARIAAICLDHGVRELWTADRDFTSYPELTIRNPLVS
jgi:toxin-antitoxin system PIN domain toxin